MPPVDPVIDEPVPPTDDGLIAFSPDPPLVLAPGSSATLSVLVSPARETTVRFALLDEAGTAALGASSAVTSPDGRAEVQLTASNEATSFRVRASVGRATATRQAHVEGVGLASVQVTWLYAGKRDPTGKGDPTRVATWTLSARANTTCESLTSPLSDGPLSVTVPATEVPLLSNVPVGPPLAVILRGGGLVSGCADVAGLFVGERRALALSLADVPLSLAKSKLLLTLAVAPEPVGWGPLVARWDGRFRGAFLGGRTRTSAAVLDAMSLRVVGSAGIAFQKRRTERGWDAAMEALFDGGGPGVLLEAWLPAATSALREAPGPIAGTLRAGDGAASAPVFQPTTVLRLRPDDGDKIGLIDLTWKVDASDVLSMGGALTFAPSRLVSRALGEVILEQQPSATSPAAGLVAVGRCPEVATILSSSGSAVDGCDAACVASLCASALADMWDRSVRTDELSGTSAKLTFGATGLTTSDEKAAVRGFSGAWVGSIVDTAAPNGADPAQLKGKAQGTTEQ